MTSTLYLSYGELGQRVRRFAAALRAIGLRREEATRSTAAASGVAGLP